MNDVLEGIGFLMCLCMLLGAFLFALGWLMARKTELQRLETAQRSAYLENVLARTRVEPYDEDQGDAVTHITHTNSTHFDRK